MAKIKVIESTKTVHGPVGKGKFNEHLDYALKKGWLMHGGVDHFVLDGEVHAATTLVQVADLELED